MYFYPFLLISSDIERNKHLANMFATKFDTHSEQKRLLYQDLDNKVTFINILYLEYQNNLIKYFE